MMAMEEASAAVNPRRVAITKAKEIPNCAPAPMNRDEGREISGPKSVIAPTAIKTNAQAANMGKSMMYIMPAMSVFFCWQYDATFSVYWIISNVIAVCINFILNKKLPAILERDKQKREAKLIKERN